MTHTLQAVAWTLIHFCWQAAAIAAIYRLVSAAVIRRSSQTRYLVALAALLLMVVSAGATFAWEIREGAHPRPRSPQPVPACKPLSQHQDSPSRWRLASSLRQQTCTDLR